MLLSKYWIYNKSFISVIISNIITTIIGYILLDENNSGGYLINWIPIEDYDNAIRIDKTLFLFFSTFIGSIVIETLINTKMLKGQFDFNKILLGTIFINVFSYVIGGIIMLLYFVFKLKNIC
jgi:hypothetical protein